MEKEKRLTFGNEKQDVVLEIKNKKIKSDKKTLTFDNKKKIRSYDKINRNNKDKKLRTLDVLMLEPREKKFIELKNMDARALKIRESKIMMDLICGDKSPVSNNFSSKFDAIASDDEASGIEKSARRNNLRSVFRRLKLDHDLMMFKIGRYFKDISDKIVLHAELDRTMLIKSQNGNSSNAKKLLLAVVIQGLTLGGYVIYHFASEQKN
jgi:hypothetical protein